MKFEDLESLVLRWAEDKDLMHKEYIEEQFMKFMEEVFEFKTELDTWSRLNSGNKGKIDESLSHNLKLEMGDVLVTLIILAKQLEISPSECLDLAYTKIAKRKGKTVNGIFVKEKDL